MHELPWMISPTPARALAPHASASIASPTGLPVLLVLAMASSALGATNPPPPPDSHVQPLVDGCQRSNGMSLTLTTPEWVYVNRSAVLQARQTDPRAGTQTVEGVVNDIHPAGHHLVINHGYNDVDLL